MASSRNDRLFGKKPGDIPDWMVIRDADHKKRKDKESKLRAARLARDASQSSEQGAGAANVSTPRRKKGSR